MSLSDVRLIPNTADPWGRGALALLSGYLCSLCTFEWSHCWDFSPLLFRPLPTALLTLGFFLTLALHQTARQSRAGTAMPALIWLAITAWPLRMAPNSAAIAFSIFSLGLLVATLTRLQAVVALMVSLPLAMALLVGLPVWPISIAVMGLALLDLARLKVARAPLVDSSSAAKERLCADVDARTAEITWRGISALFKAAVPGEGERFTTTVLADTTRIIEGYGGRRVKGSDLNGTYRFPNQGSLDACLAQLERYRRQIVDVLENVKAPPLELIVSRN